MPRSREVSFGVGREEGGEEEANVPKISGAHHVWILYVAVPSWICVRRRCPHQPAGTTRCAPLLALLSLLQGEWYTTATLTIATSVSFSCPSTSPGGTPSPSKSCDKASDERVVKSGKEQVLAIPIPSHEKRGKRGRGKEMEEKKFGQVRGLLGFAVHVEAAGRYCK